MDLKEYWAKPEKKIKRPPKYKPIWCACGKTFVNKNSLNQHINRLGKKNGHRWIPSPMDSAYYWLHLIDEKDCSLRAWNYIQNALSCLGIQD